MFTVKPYYILAERFGLFAVRPPPFPRGNGLLGCGITFDIFTHVLHRSFLLFLYLLVKCTTTFLKIKKRRSQ